MSCLTTCFSWGGYFYQTWSFHCNSEPWSYLSCCSGTTNILPSASGLRSSYCYCADSNCLGLSAFRLSSTQVHCWSGSHCASASVTGWRCYLHWHSSSSERPRTRWWSPSCVCYFQSQSLGWWVPLNRFSWCFQWGVSSAPCPSKSRECLWFCCIPDTAGSFLSLSGQCLG